MAFNLGGFSSGLSSGLQQGMHMGSQYKDAKSKSDLSSSLTSAVGSGSGSPAPAGTASGQAAAGAVDTNGSFLGGAQSDSAASAPPSSPNLNADPRAAAPPSSDTGSALTPSQRATLQTMASGVGKAASAYGNAKSDAAMSAPTGTAPGQAAAGAVQTNPTTGDTAMPVPQSAVPTQAQIQKGQVFGSSVSDWVLGRNPQNRAVHLTPTMGIATGPGPSNTPMSTSPGGAAPQYLPQGQPGSGGAPPQPGQAAPIGVRPPMLSGAPSSGSPSLANNMSPMGQAIQTGNGGM